MARLMQVYELPCHWIRRFADLLEALRVHGTALGLTHCAVTMPTLEEAFLPRTAGVLEQQVRTHMSTVPAEVIPAVERAGTHRSALLHPLPPPERKTPALWRAAFLLMLRKMALVAGGLHSCSSVDFAFGFLTSSKTARQPSKSVYHLFEQAVHGWAPYCVELRSCSLASACRLRVGNCSGFGVGVGWNAKTPTLVHRISIGPNLTFLNTMCAVALLDFGTSAASREQSMYGTKT